MPEVHEEKEPQPGTPPDAPPAPDRAPEPENEVWDDEGGHAPSAPRDSEAGPEAEGRGASQGRSGRDAGTP